MRFAFIMIVLCTLIPTISAEEVETAEQPEVEPYQPEKQELVIDKRLAEILPATEIKWLGEGEDRFLARSRVDETGNSSGNILIVPAPGRTIDSPGYVRRAVDYYPTVGWHIMVISTGDLDFSAPVVRIPDSNPATDTTAEESANPAAPEPMIVDETDWYQQQQEQNQQKLVTRISTAVQALAEPEKGYVLVAAQASAALLIDAIKERQITPAAIVMIDLNHPVLRYQELLSQELGDMTIPTLDIYQPLEKQHADARNGLQRKAHYQQRMIPGVNPDYVGVEDILLRSIRGWLRRIMK